MPWRGPKYAGELPSLGWLILREVFDELPAPNDPEKSFVLTDEQATLIIRWYALDPETGEFIYRRGCVEMAKGWGKSPLLAGDSIAQLVGPVVFDGWDSKGEPVGRPWGTMGSPPPWVQIAAVSEDQTDNTYSALYDMLTANESRAAQHFGIDEGRTRLYLRGRPGRLEPVTAEAGSREGQRIVYAVLDETYLWLLRNGGVRLARTLRRNVGKMGGRTFESTNAPVLGEQSVAEKTGKDAEAGKPGILYYARRPKTEPDPGWSDRKLSVPLKEAYGDAWWIDRKRILKEIRDPDTLWVDALRFWFNIRTAGAGKAVDPRRWDQLATPKDVPGKTPIGLGFDGSISGDATVLRGCTQDGYSFLIGVWARPPGAQDWSVPRGAVHQAVAEAFARYKVGRMFCDPPKWWTEIEEWGVKYGEDVVLAFDTNQERRFAPAVDRWLTAIRGGTHTHDGDELTAMHVRAAHLRKARAANPDDDGRTLYVLVKGDDRRLIDGAVADVLAHEAAMSMEAPKSKRAVAMVVSGSKKGDA